MTVENFKENLDAHYDDVMTADELTARYEVLWFLAPTVGVKDRKTGELGTCEFTHSPRYYFHYVKRDD